MFIAKTLAKLLAEQRVSDRGGSVRMPPLALPEKTAQRMVRTSRRVDLRQAFEEARDGKDIDLTAEFDKAAGVQSAEEPDERGDEKVPVPERKSRSNRRRSDKRRTRKRDQSKDRGR